jgi:hypothetical protein
VPEPTVSRCAYAQQFGAWAEALVVHLVQVSEDAKPAAIRQAKLLLLDKYMEWRASAPAGHRDYLRAAPVRSSADREAGNGHRMFGRRRGGHECLYAVFVATYQTLHQQLLELSPPPLQPPAPRPPASAPAPPPQIAGIFIGEAE